MYASNKRENIDNNLKYLRYYDLGYCQKTILMKIWGLYIIPNRPG